LITNLIPITQKTDDDVVDKLVESFIIGLRNNNWLSSAIIIFIPERNTGHESGRIEKIVMRHAKSMSYREKEDRNPGVFTTNNLKLDYATEIRDQLKMNSVFFMENFVCENPYMDKDKRRRETQKKLFDQLKRVRYVVKKNKTPFANENVAVSGKVNEKGNISDGYNDDLFFVFGMGLYWIKMFWREEMPGINYTTIRDLM
jgi:hypothetical protein